MVLEVPPKVLGAIDDMWYRWVIDVGITGPDKGEGGKYLLLPPGYQGEVPAGYHVVQAPTFNLWAPWRSFLVDGDPKPGVELVKQHTQIYPLADAATCRRDLRGPLGQALQHGRPGGLPLLGAAERRWCRRSRSESLDQVRLGYFAAIGIQKGKPFAPDARMKKILTEAAAVGDATARAIAFHMRGPGRLLLRGQHLAAPLRRRLPVPVPARRAEPRRRPSSTTSWPPA